MTADRYAYVDRSFVSFVISCEICDGWACVRLTLDAALEAKADHDVLVHGVEGNLARKGLNKLRARHAAPAKSS